MNAEAVGYTPFEITTKLEGLSDEPCESCDEPTTKIPMIYELPYNDSEGRSLIARCVVPGYRCDRSSCGLYGVEFYDLNASIEVLEAVRPILKEARDEATLRRINASLNAGRQHRAQIQAVAPILELP